MQDPNPIEEPISGRIPVQLPIHTVVQRLQAQCQALLVDTPHLTVSLLNVLNLLIYCSRLVS